MLDCFVPGSELRHLVFVLWLCVSQKKQLHERHLARLREERAEVRFLFSLLACLCEFGRR